MDWTLIGALIGIGALIIAGTGILVSLLVYGINRMENDIKRVDISIDAIARRMDSHAQRIDQLYKMFVDLLKEKK